jgi:sigma-E factor negative regulatory protein RseA
MSKSALPERSDANVELERLSALMDGELEAAQVPAACANWRRSASAQADWQLCHLIGDVLRSEELASPPERDLAFLNRLRAQLATEPVVLAPESVQPKGDVATLHPGAQLRPIGRRVWHRWAGPVGIAAGVVMVAGVVLTLRQENAGALAWLPASPSAQVTAASGSGAAELAQREAEANAALASYLRAHREHPGATSVAPAAGYLRNAAYEAGR